MYLGASVGRLHISYEEHLDEVSEVAGRCAELEVAQAMIKSF